MAYAIHTFDAADLPSVRDRIRAHWGDVMIVSRGRVHHVDRLPGFVAVEDGVLIGVVTYAVDVDACEIVTLNAFVERRGVGSALLDAVCAAARTRGCRRLWLVTTNDNVAAIAFYERYGLTVVAVHHGAVDEARRLKPSIPLVRNGVRISDEIELAVSLG